MVASASVDSSKRSRNRQFGTLNLGSSYATGGVAVSPQLLGLSNQINHLSVHPSGGYVFEWVPSTGKVKAYVTGAALSGVLAEVANAANLSAINPRFDAEGF